MAMFKMILSILLLLSVQVTSEQMLIGDGKVQVFETNEVFQTTEGSEMRWYFENDMPKKLEVIFYGEMGKKEMYYFIRNDDILIETYDYAYKAPLQADDATITYESFLVVNHDWSSVLVDYEMLYRKGRLLLGQKEDYVEYIESHLKHNPIQLTYPTYEVQYFGDTLIDGQMYHVIRGAYMDPFNPDNTQTIFRYLIDSDTLKLYSQNLFTNELTLE